MTANQKIAYFEYWITALENALASKRFTYSVDIERAENKLAAYKRMLAAVVATENKKHYAKAKRRAAR